MELANGHLEEIQLQCWAYVASMFATFCNPRMRGEKFKWEEFPDMMKKLCGPTIMVSLYHLDESVDDIRDELREYIEKTSKDIAQRLINNMTE